MRYKLDYRVKLEFIDGEAINETFNSIIELEAFLLGYFYGVNNEKKK